MISPNATTEETKSSVWTVVISRGQSRNPAKRAMEEEVAQAASAIDGVEVLVIPHLYDLPKTSDAFEKLSGVSGNLVVVSWIFPRAAHWVLDRNGIRGQFVPFSIESEEDEKPTPEDSSESESDSEGIERVADLFPRPEREIHCANLKVEASAESFAAEIRNLVVGSSETSSEEVEVDSSLPIVGGKIVQVEEATSRRWYPVIDFNRCTNCMECIDFCLFGVYGVDGAETILVEQPDNCRKGCPACSRVCPENAIIFPQHKAPAIAGAEVGGSEGFKIDLSKLFGAPESGDDAIETAARERDEQLLLAGRDAVGIDEQLRRRQQDLVSQPKDDLDRLIDSLDELDL